MPFSGQNTMKLKPNFNGFKKLSKEKRQQLVLVFMVTLGAVTALGPFRIDMLGFGGLINYQLHSIETAKNKTADARDELQRIQEAVKHSGQLEAQIKDARKQLAEAETDIAYGDVYAWMVNTLRQFKAGYRVDIPQFLPVGPTSEVTLLAGFPYKQVSMSVSGTAHFHDLGRFLADLENEFPHFRIVNLSLDLNPSPTTEDQETVAFKMDIVTLVKNTTS
jgi:Tfp pilus assembly protein PilO